MINNYILDPNQNVGTVIFVVEGGRRDYGGTELRLLKAVFSDLLGYRVDELRRGENEFIAYGNNPYSRVFALNLPKNQLTQLTEDSLDELFKRLKTDFKIKPEDCPIFFIYDRDYKSYHNNELRGKYVKKYTDPYSNEKGYQGQLLLSYPCVESYLLSLSIDSVYKYKYGLGKDIKRVEEFAPYFDISGGITEQQLLHATIEMDNALQSVGINDYDLDDLASVFLEIYEKQQQSYANDNTFFLFSFVSMALLELGIIKTVDSE